MKNNLRILSLTAFAISIPALIITDWYWKGYGVLWMFIFLTVGLILDQFRRLIFPNFAVSPVGSYRTNKLLNILSLILFVQSPMGLIYGNRAVEHRGFWIMAIMICSAIGINQIATHKFRYTARR